MLILHCNLRSVTIPAGITVAPTTQPAANSIKDAARTAAAAPAATSIVYKQPLVLGQKDGKPAAAIMLLHGLGDSQEGRSGLAEALLAQPGMGNVRIIIPEAPKVSAANCSPTFGRSTQIESWRTLQHLPRPKVKGGRTWQKYCSIWQKGGRA